jgi:hypothetical protein
VAVAEDDAEENVLGGASQAFRLDRSLYGQERQNLETKVPLAHDEAEDVEEEEERAEGGLWRAL